MRVDNSPIRKEKVADSKISGYVWTGPKKAGKGPTRVDCVVLHHVPGRTLTTDLAFTVNNSE